MGRVRKNRLRCPVIIGRSMCHRSPSLICAIYSGAVQLARSLRTCHDSHGIGEPSAASVGSLFMRLSRGEAPTGSSSATTPPTAATTPPRPAISANNVAGLRQRYQVELPASARQRTRLSQRRGHWRRHDESPVSCWARTAPSSRSTRTSAASSGRTRCRRHPDAVGACDRARSRIRRTPMVSTATSTSGTWTPVNEVTDANWPELVTLKPDVERVAGGLTIATVRHDDVSLRRHQQQLRRR